MLHTATVHAGRVPHHAEPKATSSHFLVDTVVTYALLSVTYFVDAFAVVLFAYFADSFSLRSTIALSFLISMIAGVGLAALRRQISMKSYLVASLLFILTVIALLFVQRQPLWLTLPALINNCAFVCGISALFQLATHSSLQVRRRA